MCGKALPVLGLSRIMIPRAAHLGPWGMESVIPMGICSPLEAGTALEAEVVSVKKGRVGAPGQLQGAFQKDAVLGTLEKNTSAVFSAQRLPVGVAFPYQWQRRMKFIPDLLSFCQCLRDRGSGIFCGDSEALSRRKGLRAESPACM